MSRDNVLHRVFGGAGRRTIPIIGWTLLVCLHTAHAQSARSAAVDQRTASPKARVSASSARDFGDFQIETLIRDSGIEVVARRSDDQIIRLDQARGLATLKISGEVSRYRFDLLPNDKGSLVARTNLLRLGGQQIELEVLLGALPVSLSTNSTLKYRDVVTLAPTADQRASAAIARQKVCPVSGKRLGSMGTPVPVTVVGKTIYACCTSCVKNIESHPEQYSAGVPSSQVSKVTAADSDAIALQKRCPVMDEPLDAMGGPYKVKAAGRAIYICCPGCAKRIKANPLKYLNILKQQGIEAPLIR